MDTPMEVRDKKSNFHLDILVSGFAEAVNVLARFAVSVLLARSLGAEGRGVYALALAAPGLLLSFTNVGIGEATTVLLGKGTYSRGKIIGSLNLLMLLICAAGGAVYFGLKPLVMGALNYSLSSDIYMLGFLIFPLALFWGGCASVALGLGMVRRVAWGRTINNLLFLAMAALLYWRSSGVKAVLAAFILAAAVEACYLFHFIRKESSIGLHFSAEIIREQLSLGWHIFWGGLFLQVAKRLDVFLVNYFLGPGPLGVYVVSFSVAEFLLTVPSVYSRAAFSSAAVSRGASGFPISNAAVRQSLFLMVAAGAGLALLMRPFVMSVYSFEFASAVLPARLLLPGVVALGFSMLLGNIFTGYARPQEITKSAFLACAATLVLDLILIPSYGITGAAAASTVAYLLGAAWMLFSYIRFSGASPAELLLPKSTDLLEYKARVRALLARGTSGA